MARKETAHRPSQANQEFVRTADGRRVRNTAYTGSNSGSRSKAGGAIAPPKLGGEDGKKGGEGGPIAAAFGKLKTYTEGGGVKTGKPVGGTVDLGEMGSVKADSIMLFEDGVSMDVAKHAIAKDVFKSVGADMPGEGTRRHECVLETAGGTFFVTAQAEGPERVNGNLPRDEDGRLIPGSTRYEVTDLYGQSRGGYYQGQNDGKTEPEIGQRVVDILDKFDAF